MMAKPWEGRFRQATDSSVERFTASIQVDRRLYPYDIAGSIAHCRTLAKAGVLTAAEADQLAAGLDQIKTELDQGRMHFDERLEDIHMHIEARLGQVAGPVAAKLHTARSRNDQVALDARMFVRDATAEAVAALRGLRQVLVDLAETHIATVMPGYTHLQRAQPVLLAHHLLAYYEMFTRDAARFGDSLKRTNVLPLGAAALAGTTYPIDRHYTAALLGFAAVAANSLDAVSDRDFMLEFSAAAAIAMVHLSRLAEELVLWSSAEFGFIELPDAFATGSSIMPQKKNPDVPELVRGKAGRVFGDLQALLALMKALPLSYNRDMQEDKPSLFSSVDALLGCLAIVTRMLPNIQVKTAAMARAAERGFLNATDLADYLAGRGVPFRDAHAIVGKAVAHALERQKELHELPLAELQRFSAAIQEDVYPYLTVEHMLGRRLSAGGTAPLRVAEAVGRAKADLAAEEAGKESAHEDAAS